MKSTWRVSYQIINGEKIYQVYRLRDVDAVDHSGNRETNGIFADEESAADHAAMLNRMEEDRK